MTSKPTLHQNKGPIISGTIGLSLLSLSIYLLVSNPCPSPTLFFGIRITIALAAAMLVEAFISGTLSTQFPPGIRTTGTAAITILIYLFNPAELVSNNDCDAERSLTVFAHGSKGCTDRILQDGSILLTVISSGETKKEEINDKGEAKFNGLKIGDQFSLQVVYSEPYRAVSPDSVYTLGVEKSLCFSIELLYQDVIFGQVLTGEAPLANVTVSLNPEVRTYTNDLGEYRLQIPPPFQQPKQSITFFKSGYKLLRKSTLPQTNTPLNVVLEKE